MESISRIIEFIGKSMDKASINGEDCKELESLFFDAIEIKIKLSELNNNQE